MECQMKNIKIAIAILSITIITKYPIIFANNKTTSGTMSIRIIFPNSKIKNNVTPPINVNDLKTSYKNFEYRNAINENIH